MKRAIKYGTGSDTFGDLRHDEALIFLKYANGEGELPFFLKSEVRVLGLVDEEGELTERGVVVAGRVQIACLLIDFATIARDNLDDL